jgi:hypothetical protein
MIAAQNEGELSFLDGVGDNTGQFRTALGDGTEIFCIRGTLLDGFLLRDRHITKIVHLIAHRLQFGVQSRQTEGGRSHIHTAATGAKIKRGTQDGDLRGTRHG